MTDGCAVFGVEFKPDPDFERRWTRAEKVQAVQHNEKVEAFCR